MHAPNINAFEVYTPIVSYIFDRKGPREKEYRNNKIKKRICLFCGKDEDDTSFGNRAHVIPEALGNRTLFTYVECDECNNKFGKSIEQDLVNDLAIIRAFSRNRSKKGHSKYKMSNSYIKSGVDANEVEIEIVEDDKEIQVTFLENNQVKLEIKSQSVNYVNVGRALARMALLLLNYDDAVKYNNLISWINEETAFLPVFYKGFIPGPGFVNTNLTVLKKNDEKLLGIPSELVIFTYSNFIYYFPFPSEDLSYAPNHPLPIQYIESESNPKITQITCKADEPEPPMKHTLVFNYQKMKDQML